MKLTLPTLLGLLTASALAQPVDIESLLQQMTTEEKLGQLMQIGGDHQGFSDKDGMEMVRASQVGSTLGVRGAATVNRIQKVAVTETRLKIPILFAFDVIHGYRTIFPVPLGEAASFDLEGMEETAAVASREAYAHGVKWTFAPMVDIARDPRWGRVVEGAGEDPYYGSRVAEARVKGFQRSGKVVACAKHWVAYGAAEAGRDYNTADMSERTLREVYFPPFKAAVDANVGTFMSSFNEIGGVPASANRFTLTEVLRGEWKWDGVVVSDFTSVEELIKHGLAGTPAEACDAALNAGVDIEMVSRTYVKNGAQLIQDGKLSQATLDESVRRVLRLKKRLGLFEDPYVPEGTEAANFLIPEHRQLARVSAARSCVLLKNDKNLLPYSKNVKSVAIIGPLGDSQQDMMGSWNGDGQKRDVVTLLAGVRAKLPGARVTFVKGCPVKGVVTDFKAAVAAARAADVVLLAVGEDAEMSGEAASRTSIDLPGSQLALIQAIHATGKPYTVVLMNGRPLALGWVADKSPAILETWFAGTEAGNGIADVLFGDVNPSGKLPITFPRNLGQVPIYYNSKNTGRPWSGKQNEKYASRYLDVPNSPQYVFGYGLSYTRFAISAPRLSAATMDATSPLTVSVEIKNVGKRAGAEVVQLYIQDPVARVTRPVRELRGFERVELAPGEARTVNFTLSRKDLLYWGPKGGWVADPGEVLVYVGNSSAATGRASFRYEP
ncbi:MAG: beta-glucosidase [Candidatus Xenobia bacterium]